MIAVGSGAGLFAFWLLPRWMRPNDRFTGPPTDPAAMRMAPPEASTELPLGGGEGVDRYGYPLKSADAVVLRSLLLAGRFGEIDRHVERFQSEAETDFHREYWIFDAASAFDTADAQVGRRIDAWVAQSPQSFAAHLARGSYLRALAAHARGTAYASDTSEERLARMTEVALRAMASYRRAIELRPRLFIADIGLLHAAAMIGDDGTKSAAYAHALSVCPLCVSPRKAFMHLSRPRWGGSVATMELLAADAHSQSAANPRLSTLRGFVDWEVGEALHERDDYPGAIAAYTRAIERGGELEDFYAARGEARGRVGNDPQAAVDYDRARALRPARIGDTNEMLAYFQSERHEEGVRVFVRALLLDPTDEGLQARAHDASLGAALVGSQHFRADRLNEALEWFALARKIEPGNGDARARFSYAAHQHGAHLARSMSQVEARVLREPDAYDAVRDLDYAISESGAPRDRIVAAWDAYLRRHPRDARAYVERAGTMATMGNYDGGIRDAVVACHLGNRVGCEMVEMLRQRRAAFQQ